MINIPDIIAAFNSKLLTESEAKSYIQRWIETNIQERQSYTKTSEARTAMEIKKTIDDGRLTCEDCGCPLINEDDEDVEEAMASIEDFVKWLISEKNK